MWGRLERTRSAEGRGLAEGILSRLLLLLLLLVLLTPRISLTEHIGKMINA